MKLLKFERHRALRKARVQNRTWTFIVLTAVAGILLLVARGVADTIGWDRATQGFVGRHLLSSGDCPVDDNGDLVYYSWTQKKNGGVILYFIGVIYFFLGIAIVCDDFFVASLEKISEMLHLSEDVAGATFMAAGSSAPELFSSIMALAIPSAGSDVGVGTIVGSAVFNVLMIIGLTAVFAGRTLLLDWKPLARDGIFYAGSIITIIIFFNDGVIRWWEGMIMVLLYAVYVLFMVYNTRIFDWLDRKVSKKVQPSEDTETGNSSGKKPATEGAEGDSIPAINEGDGQGDGGDEEEQNKERSPFTPPQRYKDYPLWLLSVPWYFLFSITVPDCSKPFWEKWYLVSFSVSVVWIGFIAYFMVDWCVAIGCILGIPNSVMSVTVLAAGTSIPDAISSIVVGKQGQGDMAVANAIGSNIFDIWIGLGLPWWIFLLVADIRNTSFGLCVTTKELLPNVLILAGVLIFYVSLIVVCKYKLFFISGVMFIILYCGFAAWQIGGVWIADVYKADEPEPRQCFCNLANSKFIPQSCLNSQTVLRNELNGDSDLNQTIYEEYFTRKNITNKNATWDPSNWGNLLRPEDH